MSDGEEDQGWGKNEELIMAPDTDEDADFGSDGGEYDYGSDEDVDGGDPFASDDSGNPFMDDEDDDDGGDEEDTIEVLLANTYYEADDLFSQNRNDEALEKYLEVVRLEGDPKNKDEIENMSEGPWTFQSMSKIVTIYLKKGNTLKLLENYTKLLKLMNDPYIHSNAREEAIKDTLTNPLLTERHDDETVTKLYDATLATLNQRDRLWFRTSLEQARLYLKSRDATFLRAIPQKLKMLYGTCRRSDGSFDEDKASDLLEVYATEMEYLFVMKNFSRMKMIYPKTKGTDVTNAVEDSRTMGPLRECGGRMWMHFGRWSLAYNEFFDAFKAYEEAGKSAQARKCIKYLVVANIIDGGGHVNPFAAREIVAYVQHSDIDAMKNLRAAFRDNEIEKFSAILRYRQNGILTDPLVAGYEHELLRAARTRVLKSLIRPYRRVRIDFLQKELLVDPKTVQKLLRRMILDDEITGALDEIGEFYENRSALKNKRTHAIMGWSDRLDALRSAINESFSGVVL